MARNTARNTRNTPRNRQKSNGGAGGIFRALLEIALLAGGGVAGWMLHAELTTPTASLPVADAQPVPTVECPTPTENESEPARNVYSHAVTGEGVIEFKFYGNDNTTVTRKWVARIPIPAGAGLPVAPESPASIEAILQEAQPEAAAPVAKAEAPAKTPAPQPVKVKAAADKPKESVPAAKSTSTERRFAIQISAHRDRTSAEERVAQMEERGFDARVIRADIPNKGTWYRVRTGRNLTREKAARLGEKLSKILGHTTSVVEQE